MCKQVDHYICLTTVGLKLAKSAAALVNPLIAPAIEVLHVLIPTWLNFLPVCMPEIAKETYSGTEM